MVYHTSTHFIFLKMLCHMLITEEWQMAHVQVQYKYKLYNENAAEWLPQIYSDSITHAFKVFNLGQSRTLLLLIMTSKKV